MIRRQLSHALLRKKREEAAARKNLRMLAAAVARLESLNAQSGSTLPLSSRVCRQLDVTSEWHRHWCEVMRRQPIFHRKQWEYTFILQALFERGQLESGRRGLGFGVGKEPLIAVMASRGVDVTATDIDSNTARKQGWIQGNQYAVSVSELNDPKICDPERFEKQVTFQVVDMNHVPDGLRDFDFVWSSCAFEHLGSIERGLRFVVESSRCLAPGGVGVHTTEFNLSSDDKTVDLRPTVLFRRQDLLLLSERLKGVGCRVEPYDFDPGEGVLDHYVDVPPFGGDGHLRRLYHEFSITSLGIIVVKDR